MEELLQLHIVVPEELSVGSNSENNRDLDDVHDLLHKHFLVPTEDVPSYDHIGVGFSSSLFERRLDNLELIDEIESQIREWYPNASVFRSTQERSDGEFRSVADPGTHIVLLVTNWSVEEPTVRWGIEKETLQAPPLVLDDEVFHANRSEIFAIDNVSGDTLWEVDGDHIIQAPVGNEDQIIVNTGHEVIALSRATGEVQWQTEFDISNDQIIDSRVAIGVENAYVGLRSGEVVSLSLDNGDRKILCECDDSVVGLQMTNPGLIATTGNGVAYLVDSSTKVEWFSTDETALLIKHTQGGQLYVKDRKSVFAVAEEDGTVEWQVDFPDVNDMVKTGNKLCVTNDRRLVAVDAKTGDQVWEYHATTEVSTEPDPATVSGIATISNPVTVSGVVACVISSQLINGEIYPFEQNTLHIFDPKDGSELQTFELGVGDCYGLSTGDDSIVCSVGGEMICIEDFPIPS